MDTDEQTMFHHHMRGALGALHCARVWTREGRAEAAADAVRLALHERRLAKGILGRAPVVHFANYRGRDTREPCTFCDESLWLVWSPDKPAAPWVECGGIGEGTCDARQRSDGRAMLDQTIGRFTLCTGADWSIAVWRVMRLDGTKTSDPSRYDPYGVFVCDDEDGTFSVTVRRPTPFVCDDERGTAAGEYDDTVVEANLSAMRALMRARVCAAALATIAKQ